MDKYKLIEYSRNFAITLMVTTTIAICFFGLRRNVVKQLSNDIYINIDGGGIHGAEEKVLIMNVDHY